jgi:hypothetical protein
MAGADPSALVPIDYHDLTAFEVEAAINAAITLLGERIRAPIETSKLRATGSSGAFSFAAKLKSFITTTPSFLRFGAGTPSANADSPPRSKAVAAPLAASPTGEDKENGSSGGAALFGQPLDAVPATSLGALTVPAVVAQLMHTIRSLGLHHEGLFRVAGNKRRVRALRACLDRGAALGGPDAAEATVHDYADLLKEYLRALPDPLVSGSLLSIYVAIGRLQDSLDAAQMVRACVFVCIAPPRCLSSHALGGLVCVCVHVYVCGGAYSSQPCSCFTCWCHSGNATACRVWSSSWQMWPP